MGNMDSIMFPEQDHPLFKFTSFFAKTDTVDAFTRSMVLVFLCFLVAFGKFISLVQVISLKTPTMISIVVFCFWMQMLCIPFYLKRTKNLYLLSHYTLGMLYIGTLFSTYSAQGYTVVNCTIFPILPLVATFLFNTFWDVIGWWSLLLLTNIGFYTFKADWEPGDFPSVAQLRDFTFLANMLCMSISAILGGVFNFSSNIKQKELELERDKAQDLSKLKSEFTANVSHEIRTPLVAVIGLSELLAKDNLLSSDQRYLINTIYSASLHLDNLVNNVLNFSKTEANMIELENTPFDVTDLVEETLLYFSAMAESCNIHLLSFIDPMSTDGFSNVTGDPHRIQQILQNLVANAIKFCSESSKGEVIITLDSIPSKEDENGRLYRFAVADNGIGMSKAGIQKLFLPFSQCDSSTTRRYGGTGLGLVICKQLCTLLGGDIEVDSEMGKGTTITFTLPLLLAVDSENENDIHPHPKKVRKMQTAAAAEAAANAAAKAADNAETAEAEATFAAKAGLECQTKPTDEEIKAAKATQEAANETSKAARATANAAHTTANAVQATADAVANAEADYQAHLSVTPQPLPQPAPLPPSVGTLQDQRSHPLVDDDTEDDKEEGREEVRELETLDLDGVSREEEAFKQNKKSTLDDLESLLNGNESPKDRLKSASTPRISKGTAQNSPFSVANRDIGALSPPLEVTRNARSLSMGKLFTSPFSPPFRVMTAAEHPPKSPNSTVPSNTSSKINVKSSGFVKDKLLMSPDFHKILTKSQDFWHHSASIPGATPKNRCVTGYLDPIMGDTQRAWAKVRNAMNTSDTVCVLAESPGSREVLKSMLLFRGISNVEIVDEEGYVNLIHQSTPPRYRVVIAEAEVFSHIGVNGLRERQKESADIILDPAVFNPLVSEHYILLVSCKYHRFGKFLEFPVPPIEGITTKEHVVKVVFCAENPVRRTSLAQSLLACVEEEKVATKNIAQGNKVQKASPPQAARSNLQILLCEDNLVNIEVLTRQLKRLGYTNLDVKHNGAEGLKAFHEKEYDIILMDCQMPILDGYETTKEIRKIEQERNTKKHVPIVALTASALPEERERGLKSGMDNYLSKPIQLAVLQNVLEGIQSLV